VSGHLLVSAAFGESKGAKNMGGLRSLAVLLAALVISSYCFSQTTAAEWQHAGSTAREQDKDYPTAIADFQRALRIDPTYADAWLGLGITYLDAGQYEQARDALRKYLTLPNQPDKQGALLFLGITYEDMRQYDNAADTFRTLLQITNERGISFKAHYELGHSLCMADHPTAAIEELQKAENLEILACDASGACADSANVRSNLGLSFYKLQRYSEALPAFKEAARLKPDDGDNAYFLGLTYARMGRRADALAEYQKLLPVDKNNAADLYAEIQKMGNASASPPPRQTVPQPPASGNATAAADQCKSQVDTQDYANAIDVCKRAVAAAPFSADAWSNLGMANFGSKHYADAAQAYQQVTRLRPHDARAHYGIGAAYEELKQYDKAIPFLREAVRLDPSNANQWYDLGHSLCEIGQYSAAAQALEKSAKLQPNDSATDYWLGRTYLKLGNQFQAMAAYDRLVGADGNTKPELSQRLYSEINAAGGVASAPRQADTAAQSATNHTSREKISAGTSAQNFADQGDKYLKAQNYQQAIAEYKKAIALDPKLGLAYYGLGLCYHQTQQWHPAVDAWNHAKALLQPEGAMYITLGNDLYHLRKYDEALKSFQQAIDIHPPDIDIAVASYWVGAIYNEEKKFESAVQPLQTAVKLRPDDPDYRSELGKAYFGAQKFPEAVAALKESVRLRPNDGTALYGLGLAYVSLHQKDEALNVYQQLKPVDPKAAQDLHEQILDEMGREIEKAIGGDSKP
jgi:tetratricopeptide (TPR) repeat protein